MRTSSITMLPQRQAAGGDGAAQGASVAAGQTTPTFAGNSDASATAHENQALARTRTVWWYGLGGLWVVDALLQAQPSMFAPNGLAGNVVLPAAQGQPNWIAVPMLWGLGIWERHPIAWNGVAILLEIVIGCLLVGGWRRPIWGRAGLVMSIVWGLMVWYFGEGLGGLFSGSPTYLAGAPGSALLYVLLASALLLPASIWASPHLLRALQVGGGIVLGFGGLLQLAPLYWSPLGLASVLQTEAMMPLPFGLDALDAHLIASMASAPVVWNAALCALLLVPAIALLFGRVSKILYLVTLAWLLFVWMIFQGCGMIFSGMATDPNTPVLWALFFVPGMVAAHGRTWAHLPLQPARHLPS